MSTIKFRKTEDGSYPYSEQDIRNAFPNTSFPPGFNPVDFGFEPVLPVALPQYNSNTQQLVELQPVKQDNRWLQNWQVIDIPFTFAKLETMKQQKKDAVTSLRYQKETGGFSFNGLDIKTDPESQSKVNSAFVSLQAGFVTEIDWKAKNGWVKLHLAEVSMLAAAIAGHVKSCFTKEKTLHELIDAIDTLDEWEQFDVSAEWEKLNG